MKLAARLVCAAALLWTCLLVLGFALEHSRTVDYSPINGRFQDFDPVRRLAQGQWIGRDFDAYLGIGPVYALRAAMLVCGDDFRASLCATYLLSAGTYAATFLVLARLCGVRLLGAALLAACATSLALGAVPSWTPDSIRLPHRDLVDALFHPGNSSQYLRAAAPFAAVLAYLGARALLARERVRELLQRRGITPLVARALACGAVAGAVALWSNDYGLPTAAALFGCAAFADAEQRGQRLAFAARASGAACVSAVLLLTLVTAGSPGQWLDYNFSGVALDQRWAFYLNIIEQGASAVTEVWLCAGLAVAIVLAVRCRCGLARAGEPWLLVFTLAALAAGFLSSRASPQPRYVLPLARVLVLVVPYLALLAANAVWTRFGSVRTRDTAFHVLRTSAVVVALVVLAWQAPLRAARLWPETRSETLASATVRRIDVPELGGPGAESLDKLVALGRRIRAEAERAGVPREQRLFATYATGLTLIADARQPTRDDYVIHALGIARRAEYIADFVAAAPLYVATQRGPAYARWELWARKRYWDFYRELYRNYEPSDSCLEHVLWRRRAQPREPVALDVRCEIAPDERERERIVLAIDATDVVPAGEVWVVDLELDFDAYAGGAPGLLAGLRDGVIVADLGAYDLDRQVAVRASAGRVAIPVDVSVGTPAPVTLRSVPAERAPPRILAARARAVARKQELERVARTQLVAAEHSDADWRHGVYTTPGASGFFVRDPFDLAELAVGRQLVFPRSGIRNIVRIDGAQVWVDGAALDPDGDGYPQWIEIARE